MYEVKVPREMLYAAKRTIASKDAEIARLREALEGAFREGSDCGDARWNDCTMVDELWDDSDARRALEASDEV